MNILYAIILGVVQGFTEFLPVSSSGHLALVPWLFHFEDPGLGFDVALHMGTLVALLVFFWRDVLLLLKGFMRSLNPRMRDFKGDVYQRLSWFVGLGSLPAVVMGKLLEGTAEDMFRSPLLIAGTLTVFGLLLYAADKVGKKALNEKNLSLKNSFLIGCAQALAVIPGVSRSGSTITAGLFLGLTRKEAARFSFLLAMPIIFGAGVLKLHDFGTGVTPVELLAGFVSSAVCGLFAIRFLLKKLSTSTYKGYAWYRFALAAVVVVVYVMRG
jgi:undecaprenyl-diphosphatase